MFLATERGQNVLTCSSTLPSALTFLVMKISGCAFGRHVWDNHSLVAIRDGVLSPMGVLLPRNLTGLCSNRALVLKSGRLSFLNVYLFVCLSRPLCSGVHVLSRASVRNFFFGVAIFMGKLAAMSTFHDKIGSTCAACEERCGLARTVLGLRFGVRHRREGRRPSRGCPHGQVLQIQGVLPLRFAQKNTCPKAEGQARSVT